MVELGTGVRQSPGTWGGAAPVVPRAELAAFLHYGYRPRVPEHYRELPWARVRAGEAGPDLGADRGALVRRGMAAFRSACEGPERALHVVPLSAGLDSRVLLGTLVERIPRECLVTVTFGIPGTLDYDLAPAVARAAGVRHEALDLTGLPVTRTELLQTARAVPWTHVFEAHANHSIPRRFGHDAAYWSGCMANSIVGADLGVPARDQAEARREFARRTRVVRNFDLTPPGFRPEAPLPEQPLLEDSPFTLYEQLFAFLRYPGFNEPILLAPGHDWRTPFRHSAWIDFMLRVPRALRGDPGFYRAIARGLAPRLFEAPTKNDLGLPPGSSSLRRLLRRARFKVRRQLRARFPGRDPGPDPGFKYADYDRELRATTALRAVVEDSLQRLAARSVIDWLDPLELWRRHQARRANLGQALVLLSALELNLAAGEPD